MAAYTEVTLDELSKKEFIGITLLLQNKVEQYTNVNTNALEEISKFNENFVKLESETFQAFLVMLPTRTWNQKFSKSSVKLVVRSSLAILRHVIVSRTTIEPLSNFCEKKIAIRSCQLRGTYEK